MPRYARAVLGGTFDHLHVGHEALLRTAFRLGRTVAIGLTTEAYLATHPKPDREPVQPFAARRRRLRAWLRREFPGRPFEVVPLENTFGRSVEPGVSVLVVSADTRAGGTAVNAERARRGVPPVPIAVVPLVLADDLRPVSSRRIRLGEIDRQGRRVAPLPVLLVVPRREVTPWAAAAVRQVFPTARLTTIVETSPRRGGGSRPGGMQIEVRAGARGRWTARESGPELSLPERPLLGSTPVQLRRALVALLRPGMRPRDPTI